MDTISASMWQPPTASPYGDGMDRAATDHYETPLARRLQAAGIPVPPPMTDEERADWERRKAEADAQPRIYGPKQPSA